MIEREGDRAAECAHEHSKVISYGLKGGLDESQIDEILAGALRILAEIGLECKHEGVKALIARRKGITVKGERFHYDKEFVREFIQKSKMNPGKKDRRKRLQLHTPFSCPKILDMDTRQTRVPCVQDLRDALKLCSAFDLGSGWHYAPLSPGGLDLRLQRLIMFKTCIENSSSLGGQVAGAGSLTEAKCICELGMASNRKPPYVALQFAISPLKLDAAALDIFYHFLQEGKINMLDAFPGAIPTAGATGPISLFGVLMQGLAENLGGEVLTALLCGKDTISQGTGTGFAFDMKYATVVLGSPEAVFLQLIHDEINAHIHGRKPEGRLHSMAKQVDPQAAAERAFGVLLKALQGATDFLCAGMISGDEIFSPEQLVIDVEIVKWVERFIKGFELDSENSIIETVKEGVSQGNYFTDEQTLRKHKDFYWMPELFEHVLLNRWQKDGAKSIQDKARDIARQKINSSEFRLDESVQRQTDEVYERVSRKLLIV